MAPNDKAAPRTFQGFTSLVDPQAWCSLFRPAFEFQLGLAHSVWGRHAEAESDAEVRERLDGVLEGLLDVAEARGTPEELVARRRLLSAYADILTTYSGLLREIAERMGEAPRPSVQRDF
ncbi:hypothetical protein [Myxococcus sp. RHSTA-1-4]|uniref:hypothetical protein n=1 Tax=Myxococcus sp. RHSTA-1-4 TaxID=2874601 RepID=UPI001CBE2CDF|nr:hypothetical protein [Myxococcus sp. RHSTA-1-4]MBZ4415766.1 hypothetical protein [Myxococcus sp. RHSTA-1-4]